MTSERRELDDTAVASDAPIDPAPRPRSTTFIPPSERYQLGPEIGRGGMGRVVEAFDTKLGRTVALKEVLPRAGDSVERRFLREVRVTARLEHPSIVPLYDSGVNAEGRPFYVMRRVTGRPLDELIRRARGLDERLMLLPAVLRAIDAIAHAHKRGVIHRDLKPSNILVGELGESVVIDWGLAKVIGDDEPEEPHSLSELKASDSLQTQFGAVFGTPGFMPPEQARGETLGFDGDVYALGATLYQLLAGTPPHQGSSVTDVMDKTIRASVTPLRTLAPGAPVELAAIVDKALSFDAAARYRDAGELAADVRRFEAGQLVAAHHYTPRQKLRRFVRRYRSVLVVGAIALGALGVLGGVGVRRILAEKAVAQAAQRVAERSTSELLRERERLILANATALLEPNPTKALAYLKQIPPASPFLVEAQGLAQSAYARGVVQAMEGPPELAGLVSFSPSERFVLWRSHTDGLRIYDVIDKVTRYTATLPRTVEATWLGDDRLLLSGPQPGILDLRTGTTRSLAIPAVAAWASARTGTLAAAAMSDGSGYVIDLATQERVQIIRPEAIAGVAIAIDGSWVAAYGSGGPVTLHEPGGREVARLDPEVSRAVPAPDGGFMAWGARMILRCHRDAMPVCSPLDVQAGKQTLLMMAAYQGDALFVSTSANQVHVFEGSSHRIFPVQATDGPVTTAAHGPAFIGVGGAIYVATALGGFSLAVPQGANHMRVLAGQDRVVAVGIGTIFIFDLHARLPRRVEVATGAEVIYADDATLAAYVNGSADGIDWFDASTHKLISHTEVPAPLIGATVVPGGDLMGQVALGQNAAGASQLGVMYIPRRGGAAVPIALGESVFTAVLGDGTVVVVGADNEVITFHPARGKTRGATFDRDVEGLAALGPSRYAVLTRSELLVGDVITGEVARHPSNLPSPPVAFAVRDDVLYAATARTVWEWRSGRFVEVAHFASSIIDLYVSRGGLVAMLAGGALWRLDLPTKEISELVPGGIQAVFLNARRTILVAFTQASQALFLELATGVMWTQPIIQSRDARRLSLSPDGTRLLIPRHEELLEYSLSWITNDYAAWLDRASNAQIVNDKLVWPWQRATRSVP